ncbi:serine/threonine protein phosphatase [Leptospira semungkisensis]|uniref:Serine/threonine protein phosphatase n=1 Tax=Leptospira semungkisensis TaxID=2484985 RepID=A0A4R9G9I1_9LEPT|nr:7TM diverse intracellular signaling domain-containing protein [Leptospira semungkisensis]TGK07547.1 serine/threonine protein phosphatase [Leptospira semungkisensis]
MNSFRKIRNSISILLVLALPLGSLFSEEVPPVFPITGSMFGVPLNKYMLLRTALPGEKKTLGDLQEGTWERIPKDSLSLSFTDNEFFVRFKVQSPPKEGTISWYFVLNNPGMENLTVYKKTYKAEGIVWAELSRDLRMSYIQQAFLIETPPNREEEFLVSASSRRSVVFNFQAWAPKEFAAHIQMENLLLGVFFGAIGIMLVYNIFLAFVVKDSSYFFYVFYLLFYALWQLSVTGIGSQYLVQTSATSWNDYLTGFAFLSVAFSLLFTRSFLHMERETGWKNSAFLILSAFAFLGFFASLFMGIYGIMIRAVSWYPFLAAVLVVYAAALRLRKGYRPARYFLLAWSVLIISVLITSLRNLSWIPDTYVTHWSAQFGSLVEMTLLSFALADRIKTLEKDSLQARLENYDNLLKLTEIEQELKIARELQESILPDRVPEVKNLKLSVRSEFASSVGGDFYDFQYLESGKLGIFLSDVSGHGVPAAIISSMVKLAFSIESRKNEDPAEVLRSINRSLSGKYGKHFITAAYLLVDVETGNVAYSNAGHPPIVAVSRSSGETKEVYLPGWIMGMDPNLKNSVVNFEMKPGDRLIIYTDGITEARSPSGEIFGFQRFYKLLGDHMAISGGELAETLFSTVRAFTGNRKHFEDDITLLILDYLPVPDDRGKLEVTSKLSKN